MVAKLWVKETKPINIEGGYLIDGFPSIGFTSAIASESLMHGNNYELAGFVDSYDFPTVSILKEGVPSYATRIYVNAGLKVGVFSSFLTINEPYHKTIAKMMLMWARKHKCSLIVSSSPMNMQEADKKQIIAAGSTPQAREKIKNAGMLVLQNGTIPGIPGELLNQGMIYGQNVIVILVNVDEAGPDFGSSVNLCMAMSKILPGVSCDLTMLRKQAQVTEKQIKETEKETRVLRDTMYG
ncbi:MAG TPA: proteasome assembly chaperone family protein [Candidatus Nitrosotenuis sp.]|nr:proteasome assembly chaperone family protein [Candidatus Nitrosotenuis sp.]HIH46392.1 proteasome assembly chaperone family protein [Candidatus Nitrosotenuis sp.]HIH68669.1 proteasome assembly chaperone family protein [Candidatus Nitrosotenuis sp.]HII04193.1 proteasome assembly chaperone family protein [Candidatus Nitrosotenuis sp.]